MTCHTTLYYQLITLTAALALTACGGGAGVGHEAAAVGKARLSLAPVSSSAAASLADGRPIGSGRSGPPADFGSRTRPGLYMTRAEAEALDLRLNGDVLWVNIECCGIEAADLAVSIAYGMQAAKNLPNSAPVLVTAVDQRLAASVVNQLAAVGMSHAVLVTQQGAQ